MKNVAKLRLAVMDMWLPFRKSTQAHAPNADILFDKFHILRHLGDALDKVRKAEYARLTGDKRKFIKGQKYVLLSHREKPDQRRQTKPEAFALREQAFEHSVPSARVLRSALVVQIRSMGAKFFDNLKA